MITSGSSANKWHQYIWSSAPQWIVNQPIAHRGLHNHQRPENSIAAFSAAANRGFAIELDVRADRHGTAMVFHDETLTRMTGHRGRVDEFSAAELGRLHLGGTNERIPRLRDVLAVVDNKCPLLIEIKNEANPGALEKNVWLDLQSYRGAVAIQAFNPFSLAWFRAIAPHIPRGQLSSHFVDEPHRSFKHSILQRLALTPLSAPAFISYNIDDLPYWPVNLHRAIGIPVLGWTLRQASDFHNSQQWIDNVIFEGEELAALMSSDDMEI